MDEFDEITKAVQAIGDYKREIFQRAMAHFNVPKEESEDRVSVYYLNSIEQVYIDHVLALTFSPVYIGLDGKVKMDIQEHYKEEQHG